MGSGRQTLPHTRLDESAGPKAREIREAFQTTRPPAAECIHSATT